MAWMVVRSCAVSIALALAGSVVLAQSQQYVTPAARNSEAVEQQNTRIVSLLEQLADQARASENLAFAVRAQSQAARLLWAQDPDRARAIYQRANLPACFMRQFSQLPRKFRRNNFLRR